MLTSNAIFTALSELRKPEAVEFIGIQIYISICMDGIEWGPYRCTRWDGYAI
jgi:hypothetical protein